MSSKAKFLAQTPGKIAIEILLIIAVLCFILLTVLVWRIHAKPLDINFAKPYIISALSSDTTGRHATMDKVVLHWPKIRGPLLIGLENVQVLDKNNKVSVSIDEAAVGLVKSRLLIGQIAPSVLILKEPTLRVIRGADGSFDFGFGDQEAETAQGDQTAIVDMIITYITEPGHQSLADSPLAALDGFKIERAELVVEDRVMNASWFVPRFDAALNNAGQGMSASFYLDLPDAQEGEAFVKGQMIFDARSKETSGKLSIKNFDVRALAEKLPDLSVLAQQDVIFDADIDVTFDRDFQPLRADLNISSLAGAFQYEGAYTEPVPFKDMAVTASYDAASKKLDISEVRITAKDVPIRAQGSFVYEGESLAGPITINIDEVKQSLIEPLWPEFLVGDNSEKWIVKNLSNGTLRNSSADMVISFDKGEQGWSADAHDIVAKFEFENMDVDYRAPMPPVTQAKGRGTFDNTQEKITISVQQGRVGALEVKSAELEFVEIIAKGKGVADINVQLTGPVKSAIDYVSHEPVALKHDFDLSRTEGQAELSVNLVFPAVDDIKTEDVKVRVVGKAHALKLPGVVGALDLTGGPYNISVKDNIFRASGKGKLGDQPVDARYEAFLESEGKPHKAKAYVTTIATPAMREKMGIDLSEFLEGSAPIKVEYTEYRDGKSEADVGVDLKTARFFIKPFDYEKPIGVAGEAHLKAHMKNGELQKITALKGSAPRFTLQNGALSFRGRGESLELSGGRAGHFIVDQSTGKIEFEISPAGQVKLILEGAVLDLQPFLGGDEQADEELYDAPPMVISVAVDKMITHEGEALQKGKIYADIDSKGRFNQMEMDGTAGKGAIYLRYKPDDSGKRVFRFEADDAGATLKAFGVYDKIIGGKMSIYAEPINDVYDRNLLGSAQITNFKVTKAPGLARLLGAMSLPGAMATLNGEGLSFTKLEAKFDWMYRRGGSLLVLKEGRTSGNSLGLTFDGTFDNDTGMVDVTGTLVPLSGINNVIGSIPLIGDILTGGSGGIFAATYKVKGAGDNPKISVNPLSVLAPGILRKILFEQ